VRCRLHNPEGLSKADVFRALPVEERKRRLFAMSEREQLAIATRWDFWARPKQLAPPDVGPDGGDPWRYFLVLAGRMFGKSRMAAEWIRARVESGNARRILLAAPRYQDVEKIMISNLVKCFPIGRKPRYVRSKLRLEFYPYGDDAPIADVVTGERPDAFRGSEWDCGWLDEFAAFANVDQCWELLVPAMRAIPPKGGVPQVVITTTPRPRKVLHDLLDNPAAVLTQGASADNAHNVAAGVLDAVTFIYKGSDLEAQELGGALLGNEPGASFRQAWFDANRAAAPGRYRRKLLAVDTSGSGKATADECGVVLVGLSEDSRTAYVLGDYSIRATPEEWARHIDQVAREQGAGEILYEANYGGELVTTTFKLLGLKAKFRPVFAKGTKTERAQPVAALVQTGKVKFCGTFKRLEMQACTWTPRDRGTSPDRMDAMVHGITDCFPVIQAVRDAIPIPGFY
jgi:phage terminase large subunit-like protein